MLATIFQLLHRLLTLSHPKLGLGISKGTDRYQSLKMLDSMTKNDNMAATVWQLNYINVARYCVRQADHKINMKYETRDRKMVVNGRRPLKAGVVKNKF